MTGRVCAARWRAITATGAGSVIGSGIPSTAPENVMDLTAIDRLPEAEARRILKDLFAAYARPAFGALSAREADLVVFAALRRAGAVARDASLYELMTALRISRAKARNLSFAIAIRGDLDGASLDTAVKRAVARPRGFVMDGSYIALGIEDPLIQAHMKERVRALGHLTDASFDSAVVRLKPGALAALVEALMSPGERTHFEAAMIGAGLDRSKTLRAALIGGLTHLARKTIGEDATLAGKGVLGEVYEQIADFVQPELEKAVASIRAVLAEAFGDIAPPAPSPKVRGT